MKIVFESNHLIDQIKELEQEEKMEERSLIEVTKIDLLRKCAEGGDAVAFEYALSNLPEAAFWLCNHYGEPWNFHPDAIRTLISLIYKGFWYRDFAYLLEGHPELQEIARSDVLSRWNRDSLRRVLGIK